MTARRLAALLVLAGATGCVLSYDPESVPLVATACTGSSVCRPQSCTDSTLTYAATCTAGTCPAAQTQSCAPYACGGAGCKTGCGIEADCASGNYCAGTSCFPKKAAGASCTAANQCQSAHCSPDGTCCNEDCTGTCEACNGVNTGLAAGTCGTIQGGMPPDPTHTQCSGDASGTCSGTCDGTTKSACVYPSTQCRPASCASGSQTLAASCSAGSCPAVVTQSCGAYACGTTACKTSCGSDPDCASGYFCDGTAHCVAKLANGNLCGGASQCQSGTCADGYCCNAPCSGCKACNLSGSVGLCSNVPAGQDPHASCSVASCQTKCNGSGACAPAASGTFCGSNNCTNLAPNAGDYGRSPYATANLFQCNASQQCLSSYPGDCGNYLCDVSQCATSCSGNSSCKVDTLCNNGECVSCSTDADCGTVATECDTGRGVCDCPGDWMSCTEGGCGYDVNCIPGGWGTTCSVGWNCLCNGSGQCNGRAPGCLTSSCTCGASAGTTCSVGQLCSDASSSGACKIAPGFPCTATASDCASGTCSGGTCTKLAAGRPCSHASDCANGTCLANWLCN